MFAEVTDGTVAVDDITLVYDTDEVKIVDITTVSKRFTANGGGFGTEHFITLSGVEESLHLDESKKNNTRIDFKLDRGDWSVVYEGYGKYGLRIVFTKLEMYDTETLWER